MINNSSTSDESSNCGSERLNLTTQSETLDNEALIGEKETKAVNISKLLVVVAITAATLSLAVVAFFTVQNEEIENFTSEFDSYSDAVVEVSNGNAKLIFKAIESLSFAITSYAVNTNVSWPFVTFPTFERQGTFACEISGSVFVTFTPFVTEEQRENWGNYSRTAQNWLEDALEIQGANFRTVSIYDKIYHVDSTYKDDGETIHEFDEKGAEHYAPIWQVAPANNISSYVNFNMLRHPVISKFIKGMIEARKGVMSSLSSFGNAVDHLEHIRNQASLVAPKKHRILKMGDDMNVEFPHTMLFQPIFDDTSTDSANIVGFVMAVFPWDNYFKNVLKVGVNGIIVVADDNCGRQFSFQINGPDILYLDLGDKHNTKYDDMAKVYDFAPFASFNSSTFSTCNYIMRVYPSKDMEMDYRTIRPFAYTLLVILTFLCTAIFFVTYDWKVQQRQNRVLTAAMRTNKIVSSLFPSNVRQRVMESADDNNSKKVNGSDSKRSMKLELKSFLVDDTNENTSRAVTAFSGPPIADLFPDCTVMFADMAGFTAWSSLRDPCQVFTLLETVYHAFDKIAKTRRVFKVETVGDSYVAVAGLPDPRDNHAVVMAKFARDCMMKFNEVIANLELILGPGTKELAMRFGLHSGPVTAGVLRGERSRFQLFGDTMNTSSRMESTGSKNRIQVSEDTAHLLDSAGRAHWLQRRQDVVWAKGKGEMQTFWLDFDGSRHKNQSKVEVEGGFFEGDQNSLLRENCQIDILAKWNKDLLLKMLKQIVARRKGSNKARRTSLVARDLVKNPSFKCDGHSVLHEVKEVINLPKFNASNVTRLVDDPDDVILDEIVEDQVMEYVRTVASMYRKNSFHNFEHATHVTMAAVKLLSRIVAPDIEYESSCTSNEKIASHLHDHTYGITSDPLTQFAVVFSAVIHDVDHTGVPNTQLAKENPNMAAIYNRKSVAEQNSIDLSWNLFMESRFKDFRELLCSTSEELQRFRQIVINSVIATDIMDLDQRNFRQKRWERAFSKKGDLPFRRVGSGADAENVDDVNRKATIVIEHLIQASDVAHTMQHWHVYRTWNERLFGEMYRAYQSGRATKDPSKSWYKEEISFFDFYIIPLAKKLKDCGVFGVSSAECLDYAVHNRDEWVKKGRGIVKDMVKSATEVTTNELTRRKSQENLLSLLQYQRDEAHAIGGKFEKRLCRLQPSLARQLAGEDIVNKKSDR